MLNDITPDEILQEIGYDDELITQLKAEIEHETNRKKTLMLNPKKYILVLKAYKQFKTILEKNHKDYTGADYTIEISIGKTPSSYKDIAIKIHVNTLETYEELPKYDSLCISEFDGTISIKYIFKDVFIEIPTDK